MYYMVAQGERVFSVHKFEFVGDDLAVASAMF